MFSKCKNYLAKVKILRSLKARLFLIILLAGIIPSVGMRHAILQNYEDRAVSVRIADVQNQFKILANHLLTYSYLHDTSSDIVNTELEQLSNLYVRDTLTGMYNRMGYRKFAGKLFEDRKRANNLLILFIDLDRLKYINDNLGHDMGDLAIRAVADAIKSTLDEEGIPVRLGGDEFLVIREELPGQEIDSVIQEIRHKVARSGNQVGLFDLSISAGYVVTDKESPKKLEDYVNEADAIMYEEKKAKKAART